MKLSTSTSGEVTSACATAWPLSLTRFTTPGGRPGTSCSAAMTAAVINAVCGAGLMTTVQPAASAGVSARISNTTGAFHGMIRPATPAGSFSIVLKTPGSTSSTWPGMWRARPA